MRRHPVEPLALEGRGLVGAPRQRMLFTGALLSSVKSVPACASGINCGRSRLVQSVLIANCRRSFGEAPHPHPQWTENLTADVAERVPSRCCLDESTAATGAARSRLWRFAAPESLA